MFTVGHLLLPKGALNNIQLKQFYLENSHFYSLSYNHNHKLEFSMSGF